jgi:hypothetical protein
VVGWLFVEDILIREWNSASIRKSSVPSTLYQIITLVILCTRPLEADRQRLYIIQIGPTYSFAHWVTKDAFHQSLGIDITRSHINSMGTATLNTADTKLKRCCRGCCTSTLGGLYPDVQIC